MLEELVQLRDAVLAQSSSGQRVATRVAQMIAAVTSASPEPDGIGGRFIQVLLHRHLHTKSPMWMWYELSLGWQKKRKKIVGK